MDSITHTNRDEIWNVWAKFKGMCVLLFVMLYILYWVAMKINGLFGVSKLTSLIIPERVFDRGNGKTFWGLEYLLLKSVITIKLIKILENVENFSTRVFGQIFEKSKFLFGYYSIPWNFVGTIHSSDRIRKIESVQKCETEVPQTDCIKTIPHYYAKEMRESLTGINVVLFLCLLFALHFFADLYSPQNQKQTHLRTFCCTLPNLLSFWHHTYQTAISPTKTISESDVEVL